MPDEQQFSVVNRVRFTAWAWLLSAFFVGLTVGALATGVPLSMRLEAANESFSRLTQVRQLEAGLEDASDLVALGVNVAGGPVGKSEIPVVGVMVPPAPAVSTASAPQLPVATARAAVTLPSGTAELSTAQVVSPRPPSPTEAPAISAEPPHGDRRPASAAATQPPAPVAQPSLERTGTVAQRTPPAAVEPKAAVRERKVNEERDEKRAKAEREQQALIIQKAPRESAQREREASEARAAAHRAKVLAESRPAAKADAPAVAPAAAPLAVPASMNGPTERVTKDEAGLADVHSGTVVFKSGRRVSVGETFPSGERLLSVDPVLGEIVTSRRRIVLKAS